MKKRLEESIERKSANLHPNRNQKVGSQVTKWLKENPGFEKAVAAKLTAQHKLEIKRESKIRR